MADHRLSPTRPCPSDAYQGRCWVCGDTGVFERAEGSIRETYGCPRCGGTLRYQAQAQLLTRLFSQRSSACVSELATEDNFRSLAIYEPGTLGPFRAIFARLPNYHTSAYWPDVGEGESRDGRRCENLMHLTYEDESFDLVITSDVFEHVRKPLEAFAEVRRVLRPHGAHVFSIPVWHPLPQQSVARVDTSGPDDVPILPPVHHNGHLVYTDFGADLLGQLERLGSRTEAVPFDSTEPGFGRVVTFCSVREEA